MKFQRGSRSAQNSMMSVTRRSDGTGWKDVGAARDELLEDVVLRAPGEPIERQALLLRQGHVHGQDHRRGGVDGVRRAGLLERDAVEEHLHVPERADRHAHLADLAAGSRVVGIEPVLGGQIEGDIDARHAALEHVAEPAVRLLGGAEAGVLPHGPEPAPVHGGIDAARERILARLAEIARGIEAEARQVCRRVEALAGPLRLLAIHGRMLAEHGYAIGSPPRSRRMSVDSLHENRRLDPQLPAPRHPRDHHDHRRARRAARL